MNIFKNNDILEVGVDEAGRGSLAGYVYAAAVILPHEFDDDIYLQIKDSKKLSRKKRAYLKKYIENVAIDYGVGFATNDEIDNINILNASILAMHRALDNMKIVPDKILVDGIHFKHYFREDDWIEYECIPKGDNSYYSIAAGSILAKESHDHHVSKILEEDENYRYDWENNMCYGTQKHRDAIKKWGLSKYHRRSFNLKF
jgi:ribonuclease HII